MNDRSPASMKYFVTGGIVLVAVLAAGFKYWNYLTNPWTRDGQVRANVIQVAARVSGPIVELPIRDNQHVMAGDLLFRIDPRTYQASLDEAVAALEYARAYAAEAKDLADRGRDIRARNPGAMSKEELTARINAQLAAEAGIRQSEAALENARLDLEFTEVRASVDGFVTNLDLRLGSQAVENQPALALVDANSFWVDGFFRETTIADIRRGDRAVVTLMSYPGSPLVGRVDSLGWGISQDDGSTGDDLLPNIEATFEWIRLAQRIPVRIHIEQIPDHVRLRVGTTASVLVESGTAASSDSDAPVPVPTS